MISQNLKIFILLSLFSFHLITTCAYVLENSEIVIFLVSTNKQSI